MDTIAYSSSMLASTGVSSAVVVLICAAVLVVFLMLRKKKAASAAPTDAAAEAPVSGNALYAPVTGKVIPLSEVADEAFSSGMMGKGVAFEPAEGAVYAPCSGTISTFFPTGHAIGIVADDGAEVLIHVGMDTVGLNGKGFTPKAKEGDRVKKGQLLLNFDIAYIQSQNLSVVTPMLVTNSDDYTNLSVVTGVDATNDTVVITY